MRILLTGGAGDLGKITSKLLIEQHHLPIRLDIRPSNDQVGVYIAGSITDRASLANAMKDIDCIVHIAAWHGLHEFRKEKDAYEFWELNVTGTFFVFEAAASAGIDKVIFISSTSIEDPYSLYGHTKILGEEIACTYAARHNMNVIILRPRAFIPHWNTNVYQSYIEWARWFWSGAVHIDDVAQAVIHAVALLEREALSEALTLTIDGAYEYTHDDLANWSHATFDKYYGEYRDLVLQYGLNPDLKPTRYDISEAEKWLGYVPQFSLKNLLEELQQYGESGPPPP